MIKANTSTYHRFAFALGALGLIAVACSDNDSTDLDNNAGSAGTTAGSSNAGNSNGGKGSAGKSNGGASNAGASNAGSNNGGAGASNGGSNNGGNAGSSAAGMSPQMGGDGGDNALGGQGNAGESMGGAAGSDEAGAGGAPGIVADELDNGTFTVYEDGTGNWKDEGDASASNFKWIYGSEPGLSHWAATAYIVATLQTVSPLPNGTYSFSMDVERAANLNDQYLFARGCKAGDPTGLQKQSTAAASSTEMTKITLSNIEVSSGSCTVGIYTDAPADGWANIDNAVFALQ